MYVYINYLHAIALPKQRSQVMGEDISNENELYWDHLLQKAFSPPHPDKNVFLIIPLSEIAHQEHYTANAEGHIPEHSCYHFQTCYLYVALGCSSEEHWLIPHQFSQNISL